MSSIFYDDKDLKQLAEVKRFMEYLALVPGVKEEFEQEQQAMLDRYHLDLTLLDVAMQMPANGDIRHAKAIHPNRAMEKYIDFMKKKLDWRDELRKRCEPKNETMQKWRQRQVIRCEGQLGIKNAALIHAPFTVELASGCSIGCHFCGLNAGKLKKVFIYTEENAVLWRGVLQAAKELLGDSAGYGTCYYATEPLDNPDYEKFIADYKECFHRLPQITTAAGTRDIERTRQLIHEMTEEGDTVYRLSIRSLEELNLIFDNFTREELILVELLPQYPEAPSSGFVNAGRLAEEKGEHSGTIACLTGFVVNMCDKTIRLTTPTNACAEYPTGEVILCQENFKDADELAEKMQDIIKNHMKILIGPKEKLELYPYYSYTTKKDKVMLSTDAFYQIKFDKPDAIKSLNLMVPKLMEGTYTKSELTDYLREHEEGGQTAPEYIFWLLNFFWKQGLIVDHDLYPDGYKG
ncbi:MAG: radical SAM family RiPP maturation amino acid epimerase [bacterium]|nr:radical SAM family RiPP maturation amino acid epimerase [bacterium]